MSPGLATSANMEIYPYSGSNSSKSSRNSQEGFDRTSPELTDKAKRTCPIPRVFPKSFNSLPHTSEIA